MDTNSNDVTLFDVYTILRYQLNVHCSKTIWFIKSLSYQSVRFANLARSPNLINNMVNMHLNIPKLFIMFYNYMKITWK